MQQIGIVGAGAWGTALAITTARAGRDVVLWTRNTEVAEAINCQRENQWFLPGIQLPPTVRATSEFEQVASADVVMIVTPAQHSRIACRNLSPYIKNHTPLIICSKGIELNTGHLMTEVASQELPGIQIGVLSGPTFASDVANGLPSAVTLAVAQKHLGYTLVKALGGRTFRPYLCDDIIGVQVGGAVKNVLAIACGILKGRDLGDNALSALISRGLAEIARLGIALGGRLETIMGLSGVGDLILTCNSFQSRNFSLGFSLGKGEDMAHILKSRSVTEGVHTARAVKELARLKGVEMPICSAVDSLLSDKINVSSAIEGLLSRPLNYEWI